jgi:hypothetical protein
VLEIQAAPLRALAEEDCHPGHSTIKQIARALAERLTFARGQLAAAG